MPDLFPIHFINNFIHCNSVKQEGLFRFVGSQSHISLPLTGSSNPKWLNRNIVKIPFQPYFSIKDSLGFYHADYNSQNPEIKRTAHSWRSRKFYTFIRNILQSSRNT